MILSKDVLSHGSRAGVQLLGQPRVISRRLLSAAQSDTITQVCVLLGALAAPILSLIGWVGLVLPESTALHHAAAGLLASALIGLGIALIGAHNAKDAPDGSDGSHPHAE